MGPALLAPLAFGALGLGASALGLTPKTKAPAPLPTVSRDDARAEIAASDALRKRRGGAADIMGGSAGMEAAPATTGKTTLGS